VVVDKVLKFSLGLIQGELKGRSIVLVGINLVKYLLILLDQIVSLLLELCNIHIVDCLCIRLLFGSLMVLSATDRVLCLLKVLQSGARDLELLMKLLLFTAF